MQVVVAGMHRSGTSVVTRLLNASGFHVGSESEMMQAMPDNPAGYWERLDFFELNTLALEHAGATWDTALGDEVEHLAPKQRNDIVARFRDAVQNLEAHRPWAVKDPRFSVLFPLWKPLLAEPVVVICHRDPVEVATSLLGRDGMPLSIGVALWEVYNLAVLQNTRTTPRVFVAHRDLMTSPVSTAEAMIHALAELGGRSIDCPSPDEIGKIVDPKLYRSKSTSEQAADLIGERQRRLLEALEKGEGLDDLGIDDLTPSSRGLVSFYRETRLTDAEHSTNGGSEVERLFRALESEKSRLAEEISELHVEKARLGEKFDQVNRHNSELGAELESAKIERGRLQDEVHRLDSLHRDVSGRLEQANRDLEATGVLLEKQNQRSDRLASDLIDAHGEKMQLAKELDEAARDLTLLNEEVERLRQVGAGVEDEVAELRDAKLRLERSVESVVTVRDDLAGRLEETAAARDRHSGRLAEVTAERDRLRGSLEQAHRDLENLGSLLESVNAAKDGLARDLIQAHADKEAIGAQLEQRTADLASFGDAAGRLESMSAEHERLTQELIRTHAEKELVGAELEQRTADLAEFGETVDRLSRKVAEFERKAFELRLSRDEERERLEIVDNELRSIQGTMLWRVASVFRRKPST